MSLKTCDGVVRVQMTVCSEAVSEGIDRVVHKPSLSSPCPSPPPPFLMVPSRAPQGPVTEGNKAQYVSGKARLILVESRKPALEALKEGFARALEDISAAAAPFMGLLSHADWRVLLCGEEHVSGPQVRAEQ